MLQMCAESRKTLTKVVSKRYKVTSFLVYAQNVHLGHPSAYRSFNLLLFVNVVDNQWHKVDIVHPLWQTLTKTSICLTKLAFMWHKFAFMWHKLAFMLIYVTKISISVTKLANLRKRPICRLVESAIDSKIAVRQILCNWMHSKIYKVKIVYCWHLLDLKYIIWDRC